MTRPHLIDPGPLWTEIEAETSSAGVPIPLFHRSAWATHIRGSRHRLLAIHDRNGHPLPSVVVQIDRSRILPFHQLLRVHRFGHGLPNSAWEPTVAALARLAQSNKRVLRLSIGVFSREHRAEVAALLARHGFTCSPTPQSYRHTLTLDLRPSLDEIVATLHKTARKNLRAVEKSPFTLRVLTSDTYADRLTQLQAASLSRTSGNARPIDWTSILALSGSHPHLSRVVGLFTTETDLRPESLVGFAWGCMHGDHAEYRSAGTLRPAGTNLPLSYPLLWNLIKWGREEGATWFDLGGITGVPTGNPDPSAPDPLAGISDFKRYFSRTVEEVGDEWALEPHPTRARLAAFLRRVLGGLALLIARLRSSRRPANAPDLLPPTTLPLRPQVVHDRAPHPPDQQDHPT